MLMKPLGLVMIVYFLLLSTGCSFLTGNLKSTNDEIQFDIMDMDSYKSQNTFVRTKITKGTTMHTIVATGRSRLTFPSAIQRFANHIIYRFCTSEDYAHFSVKASTWKMVNNTHMLTSQFSCQKKLI